MIAYEQFNIFEISKPKYKITKPIRIIENFAGIGSQAKAFKNILFSSDPRMVQFRLAMKRLGIDSIFEHYKVVEFDKYAIASYNAIHGTNFEPLDITKITAKDLNIVNTDKYEYIMTYSFPCQDLSPAGKGAGMKKGSDTRSGLLWEVERLLKECKELPQILLLENVPQIIGKKHFKDFRKWQLFLEKLGYSNYFELLNAKDYSIPQNRNRCYMISILGDYYYQFPRKQKLKYRLKDFLEDEVDEKYYLSDKMIKYIVSNNDKWTGNNNKSIINRSIARTINTGEGSRRTDASNYIATGLPENFDLKSIAILEKTKQDDIGVVVKGNYSPSGHNASRIVDKNGIAPTVMENHGTVTAIVVKDETGNTSKLRQFDKNIYIDEFNRAFIKIGNMFYRIRKLTPKECWRLMGFSDEDFDKASKVNSNSQLYKQAGNSIVVNVLEAIFKELIE